MPELPEVETARRGCEAKAQGKAIVRADALEDARVFEGCGPDDVTGWLQGRTIVSVHRRGKYIWWALDRRPWPVFHFGMTGGFHWRAPGSSRVDGFQLATGPTLDQAWPPRFTKLILVLDDGTAMAMTNARRLGRVRFRDDPRSSPPLSQLGFDPLVDPPSLASLQAALATRRATLKGLLLDQSFAAGVGNWVADEVLLAAGLDPRRRGVDLSAREVASLRSALLEVVTRAVDCQADSARFPPDWLFHRRFRPSEPHHIGDDRVEFTTIAGRTTAWVPARQR